ncbi:MAG: metallophosphoesterase [Clostridia bacterium]|nr:metallophosphoesterase [Clostridia bacterium]
MKIAVICDLHLPLLKRAAQYCVLDWAIDNIIAENADLTVVAGDVCAGGDIEALNYFLDKTGELNCMFLLGNSDIRNPFSRDEIVEKYSKSRMLKFQNCRILGISTPYTYLTENDKGLLLQCCDNDIVVMHHDFDALKEESREFLKEIFDKKSLIVIHGHKHMEMENTIGKTKLIGVAGLDPDKAKGLPSVTYFDFVDNGFKKYDRYFEIDKAYFKDVLNYIGISCFNPETDIDYAIENGLKNIEIQLRVEKDIENYDVIKEKVAQWRKNGGKYLSCHLPELRLTDGELQGVDRWYKAIDLLLELEPDGVTVHVPRAKIKDMIVDGKYWRMYLTHFVEGLKKLSHNTKIGIENLHMLKGYNKNDEERLFGIVPEECLMWIDALNVYLGENRVEALLDIGHATNNSVLRERYTRSVWYEIMGKRTVAYHAHQVVKTSEGLANHYAISDWLGMTISYASFFWAWGNNRINHMPIFLEMRSLENCDISIKALKKLAE